MIKKILLIGVLGVVLLFLFILLINLWIIYSTKSQRYSDIDLLPKNKVGLLLGTTSSINGRHVNPYFANRIDAAVALYEKGKVEHLILSGDNGSQGYNEPADMRKNLLERGIPDKAMTLDYAGFRTLDSVVRSKAVFQQNKLTIISQEFHNPRAVFIANKNGIEVVAYNGKNVFSSPFSKVKMREYLARFLTFFDLYIWNRQPKFYGEKIDIDIGDS